MSELAKAIKALKRGEIVAYPTDTAYGLAVDATNVVAVKKLFQLKGRNFKNPIHVIPPTKAWIEKLVKLNPAAKKLIEEFMPGPLTLVLPCKASGKSWEMLSSGTQTLGIRRPKHKLALDLASGLARPITTTSANVSGKPNCYSIAEVKDQLGHKKGLFYLDGGKLPKRKPSTVVALANSRAKILRVGPISETQIKNVFSKTSTLLFI